jgi:hypothetical protein
MSGLSCEQARNLFDTYLDNELSDDLVTELVAHRVRCASCRHELALLEVAGQVIRADREEPAPAADFTNRLMACIQQRQAPVPVYRRPRTIWLAGTALAAAACLLLAVTLWPEQPRQAVLGGGREYNKAAVNDAAADLQKGISRGVLTTRQGVTALQEAGRRTLLEFVRALRPVAPGEQKDAPDQRQLRPGLVEDL